MTVQVARIVGLPTSSTAFTACSTPAPWCLKCRWMFSTTTMASSTRIPMEKMRAKRVTRFSV